MIRSAIQIAQGQTRGIKLDLEAVAGISVYHRLRIWIWFIEFVAQTTLVCRLSGDNGLTAIRRIRDRSSTAPKLRFEGKVMYEVAGPVRFGKADARWK